jgi:hypothetical protein
MVYHIFLKKQQLLVSFLICRIIKMLIKNVLKIESICCLFSYFTINNNKANKNYF